MTAKIRITADSSAEAAKIRDQVCSVLEVYDNGREYPNRNGSGVRRYLDVRIPGPHAQPDRDEQPGLN